MPSDANITGFVQAIVEMFISGHDGEDATVVVVFFFKLPVERQQSCFVGVGFAVEPQKDGQSVFAREQVHSLVAVVVEPALVALDVRRLDLDEGQIHAVFV